MTPIPTISTLPEPPADRSHLLQSLGQQIRDLQTMGRPSGHAISSGYGPMDRCLPDGGYAPGSTLELVRGNVGLGSSALGTMTLALALARGAIEGGKYLLIVDQERQFYPPAMSCLGIPLERVIVLRPTCHTDAIWGLDQSLRCSAIGATIATMQKLDDRVARRLQLATEQGGGLGILIRDIHSTRFQPSWAEVQWIVRASHTKGLSASLPTNSAEEPHTRTSRPLTDWQTRWLDLELSRVSGGRAGTKLRIGIDRAGQWVMQPQAIRGQHEHAGHVHLAAQLAVPTRRRQDMAG